MVSGVLFGAVAACVFLSRGRLLLGFSLLFAAIIFLRLCVGVSVSILSSGPKQARKVSSVIFRVRACGCVRSARCCRFSCVQLVTCVCFSSSPALTASDSDLVCDCSCCFGCVTPGCCCRCALLVSASVIVWLMVSRPSAVMCFPAPASAVPPIPCAGLLLISLIPFLLPILLLLSAANFAFSCTTKRLARTRELGGK